MPIKKSTEKLIDTALDDYREEMVEAATEVAVSAHVVGDVAAYSKLGIPIAENVVQEEALKFGKVYAARLSKTGGTIIQGKQINWLEDQVLNTRKDVYNTIKLGLEEGKPVASIGGKLAPPGTVAHDLKNTLIRDKDFEYVRIARTETARIQNQATLSRFAKNGITHVNVVDGTDFDEECAAANGQVWTVEYAQTHELEHPNCTRTFGPVITADWEPPAEEIAPSAPKKKPLAPTSAPAKPPITEKPLTVPDEIVIEKIPVKRLRDIMDDGFKELSPGTRSDAIWKKLENRGWKGSTGEFNVKNMEAFKDTVHLAPNGDILAISRFSTKGDTIKLLKLEMNAGANTPAHMRTVMKDIVNDGITRGATEVSVSMANDGLKAIARKLDMEEKLGGLEFSGRADWFMDISERTVLPNAKKEKSKIARFFKKADPEDATRYDDAIKAYTKGSDEAINGALREGGLDTKKIISSTDPDELARLNKVSNDLSDYIRDAPKFEGEVYRGLAFKDDKDAFMDFMSSVNGKTHMPSQSFTSTTMNKDIAGGFTAGEHKVTMVIDSNHGAFLGGKSKYSKELEILYDKGTNFKITDIIKVSDTHYEIRLTDVI